MTNDKIEEIVDEAVYNLVQELETTDCQDSDGLFRKDAYDVIVAHLTTFADEIRKERVTHCDDINCPECPKAAYEAGSKAERERVREWAKKQYFATTADGKRVILNNTLVDFLSDNK